jgi:3-oxoacyl-[acyl-carrier-protein] synthase II
MLITPDQSQGILPPTINLESKTDDFDCNYVANTAQENDIKVAITNSFGFGGTNASLCFTKYGA